MKSRQRFFLKCFIVRNSDPECSRGLSFSHGRIRMADLSSADSIESTTQLLEFLPFFLDR